MAVVSCRPLAELNWQSPEPWPFPIGSEPKASDPPPVKSRHLCIRVLGLSAALGRFLSTTSQPPDRPLSIDTPQFVMKRMAGFTCSPTLNTPGVRWSYPRRCWAAGLTSQAATSLTSLSLAQNLARIEGPTNSDLARTATSSPSPVRPMHLSKQSAQPAGPSPVCGA